MRGQIVWKMRRYKYPTINTDTYTLNERNIGKEVKERRRGEDWNEGREEEEREEERRKKRKRNVKKGKEGRKGMVEREIGEEREEGKIDQNKRRV